MFERGSRGRYSRPMWLADTEEILKEWVWFMQAVICDDEKCNVFENVAEHGKEMG